MKSKTGKMTQRMINLLKKMCCALAVFAAMLIATGCISVQNNERTINELANHMMLKTGAAWDGPWEVGPPGAESGFALRINDRQVVFLKYNTDRKKMQKKLDYVDEHGYLYIMTLKFPAMRHGSFVMIDYEAFPGEIREKLIDAFQSF